MTERPSAETFQAAVGTAFTVSDAGGTTVELTLTAVEPRDQDVPGAPEGWVPFTLRFDGPLDPFVPQGTYVFEHAATGRLDVFVVPVGQDAGVTRYEAVFG